MTREQNIRQRMQETRQRMQKPPRLVPKNEGPECVVTDAPPLNKSTDLLADQHIANLQANRELRGRHAKNAFYLALGCLAAWWIVIFAQGIGNAFFGVEVWSSTMMIAITTGVTVNVLAVFLGVIRGLFGKDG